MPGQVDEARVYRALARQEAGRCKQKRPQGVRPAKQRVLTMQAVSARVVVTRGRCTQQHAVQHPSEEGRLRRQAPTQRAQG